VAEGTPPPAAIAPVTAHPAAPAATPSPAPACPANLAATLASTGAAAQLITVDSVITTTTFATITLWQRAGRCWAVAAGPWQGRIGTSGFSDHHREGDGTTPTGAYGIGPDMYGNAPNPGVRYVYHDLVCGDWWDGDPRSATYNTFQHVPCLETPPFAGNSEALWLQPQAYSSFAVVQYNTGRVPGAGSAIFVHADTGAPTAGCVALPRGELDQLLRWLNPASSPLIVMGPDREISRF
jgi:L,D-peptidoglycan transpeptidase YkuD (ErfK/YbiS/YcfS/YnhG family)